MKKKILLALLIVLILLGVGGAYAYFATDIFKTGKELFFSYLSADMTSDSQDEKLTEYLKKQEETAYTNKGEISIKANGGSSLGLTEENLEMLNKSKITFEGKTDNIKKLAEQTVTADFSLGFNIPINFKRDGDTFGIQSNFLDSKFIAIRNENLKALLERFDINAEEVPDKIEFTQEQFTQEELKTLQERYVAILNQNLEEELFSKEKADGQTIVKLKMTGEEFADVITKILEVARDDEILLNKMSGIYGEEELRQNINDLISELKDMETDGNEILEIRLFAETKSMKKLEIELKDDSEKALIVVEINNENQVIVKVYENDDLLVELDISKETTGNDVSCIVKMKINSEEEDMEMNFKLQYKNLLALDNVEENYEINVVFEDTEMNLKYKNLKTFSPDVEVEGLNTDNATIINDATDEELQNLMMTIYQNLGLMQ